MIRMEIACFLVVAFMSYMYFSAKRARSELHRVFSICLIVTMVHIFFDGLTIYTVNNMDKVPEWFNVLAHRFFIGTMIVVFYLMCRYIALLMEYDTGVRFHIHKASAFVLMTGLICSALLPITFVTTPYGNYSYGPVAYMLYIIVFIYLLMLGVCIVIFWRRMQVKKRIIITSAISIMLIAFAIQAIYPLALISGLGVMLVILAFYLLNENPDLQLAEQVKREKIKAEEANRAKSIFLSNMSHEIRTPLNAVLGMTDILLDGDITDTQKEYLNNIKNSGKSLVCIISDILDISKIESGKIEIVECEYDFYKMVEDIQMIIENRIGNKNLSLEINVDKSIPMVLIGDGQKIRQVIINLMNNAVKYSDSGKITLTIRNNSTEQNTVHLYVSVKDTGIGIKEEDKDKLFLAFERVDTKINAGKEGSGLGLAISKQYVNLMGGELEVKSTYGIGSEFYFTINQGVSITNNMNNNDEKLMSFTAPEAKVLVVDDNKMNCKVAKGLLLKFGVQIDIADNGYDAIDMVSNNTYNLVFMDHMMPEMDGIETVKRIRSIGSEKTKNVIIIALTANAMLNARDLFKEAGMNDFLAKPIDVVQLAVILRKWLPSNIIIEKGADSIEKHNDEDAQLKGIDIQMGITNAGDEDMWKELLRDFYLLIDSKSREIEGYVSDRDFKRYTVEVHGLKTNARIIGAKELSDEFYMLEQLGNQNDADKIFLETPKVLMHYREYKSILHNYGKDTFGTQEVSLDDVLMYLNGLRDAIEAFDLDLADEAFGKLKECSILVPYKEYMNELEIAVRDVSMERIIELVDLIKSQINDDK